MINVSQGILGRLFDPTMSEMGAGGAPPMGMSGARPVAPTGITAAEKTAMPPPEPESKFHKFLVALSQPDTAAALSEFGARALAARQAGMGLGAGFAHAGQGFGTKLSELRKERIKEKRDALHDDLMVKKYEMEIEEAKDRRAAAGVARAALDEQRRALAGLAGDDPQMQQLSKASPELMLKLMFKDKLGGDSPADVQSYQFYSKLSPEEQNAFLRVKRAAQIMDLGDKNVVLDPLDPTKTAGQFEKGVSPDQQPDLKRQQKEAELGAIRDDDKLKAMPKAMGTLRARNALHTQMDEDIDRALKLSSGKTTGMTGKYLQDLAGSDAHDLQQVLIGIKGNIGFDKLQDLRDNSPTGGALGGVSTFELQNLQSIWGSLEQSQSKEQFDYNLKRLKKAQKNAWENIADAYEQDFGKVPGYQPIDKLVPQAKAPNAGGWSITPIGGQ